MIVPSYAISSMTCVAGLRAVVAPGFLQNPEVRQWLNGIEPAWTMLDFGSYNALNHEPPADNHAIRLEPNLTETDLSGSAVTHNALILLRSAADESGLKLTQTGNLSRAVVAEMLKGVEWPDLDKSGLFRYHNVINEPDFFPVHFVRVLLQATKLVQANGDKLVPTSLGVGANRFEDRSDSLFRSWRSSWLPGRLPTMLKTRSETARKWAR